MNRLFLDVSGKTDLGTSRELNEDSCLTALGHEGLTGEVRAVFAVSDGMGGHDAGDVASKIACEYVEYLFAKGNFVRHAAEWEIAKNDYPALIREALYSINRKIIERAKSFNLLRTMGCTCVVSLLVCDAHTGAWKLVVGNIGDSRCYLVRNGEIHLATEDDSVVWQLYRKKEISYAEMRTHPKRNVLTQALGVQDSIRPQVRVIDIHPDDIILLCSDGLYATIPEDEIKKILLTSSRSEEAAEKLTARGNRLGAKDNIAVAVAYCAGEKRGIPQRKPMRKMARMSAVIVPVILAGLGSAVLLSSAPGAFEDDLPTFSMAVASVPPQVVLDSTFLLRFALEPYEVVSTNREHYRVVRTIGDRRDTIRLAGVPEAGRNRFQLPGIVRDPKGGTVTLSLLGPSMDTALCERSLALAVRPSKVEKPSGNAERERPARKIQTEPLIKLARGQDGYIQLLLGKNLELNGDATAEISAGDVVEILALNKQNKFLPKSTSIEYRSGESVRVRFLGSAHAWTMRLP